MANYQAVTSTDSGNQTRFSHKLSANFTNCANMVVGEFYELCEYGCQRILRIMRIWLSANYADYANCL